MVTESAAERGNSSVTIDPRRVHPAANDVSIIGVTEHLGMTVERVSVPDLTDHPRHGASRSATQAEIMGINERLGSQRHWAAPELRTEAGKPRLVANNPAAAALFAAAPSLKVWREKLVPTAMALTSLYEPEAPNLPTGDPIDEKSRSYFLHSVDAVGIRSRAAIMADLAAGRVSDDGSATRWTSIACGAAIPVLDAVGRHAYADVRLTLVDLDPRALEHAAAKAGERGLVESVHFELLKRNVIKDLIVTDNLVRELGAESQHLVDMLGIFEYIHTDYDGFKSAAAFLANAFRLVAPGGALVAANMLDTHPQLHFIQRGIGWPRVFPRSLDQIHGIVVDAGIDPDWVTVRIAEDGVYAVFEIAKPDPAGADEPVAA